MTNMQGTPVPRPPTDAERATAAYWRAEQMRGQRGAPIALIVITGVLLLGGACAAYLNANHGVRLDNVYMAGDQAHAANYGPAIFLAIAGVCVLLVAAIMGQRGGHGRR